VFYRGPHRLYCVEREGRTLKEHFETADQAWGWLAQYNRTTSPQEAA
jgi:hypothetical protein